MKPSPSSVQAILDYYNRYDETSRLKSDIGTENEPALGPRLLAAGRKLA